MNIVNNKYYKFYFSLGVKMYVRGKPLKDLDDPLFDYLAEDRFIIGDSYYCYDEFVRYKEQLGIKHFILRMVFP
jgi:hypothetical protein